MARAVGAPCRDWLALRRNDDLLCGQPRDLVRVQADPTQHVHCMLADRWRLQLSRAAAFDEAAKLLTEE